MLVIGDSVGQTYLHRLRDELPLCMTQKKLNGKHLSMHNWSLTICEQLHHNPIETLDTITESGMATNRHLG